jgi:hypothetical protein
MLRQYRQQYGLYWKYTIDTTMNTLVYKLKGGWTETLKPFGDAWAFFST